MTQDLNALSMSELIDRYNVVAATKSLELVTEFKSLKAARNAVEQIENATQPQLTPVTTKDIGGEAPKAKDPQKYNSKDKRGPNQGVGAFAKELIAAGLSNADVLTKVQAKFPDAKTSKSCIAFYRTKLTKADGKVGPTPEALRKQAEELLEKANTAEAAQKAAAEALATAEAAKATAA